MSDERCEGAGWRHQCSGPVDVVLEDKVFAHLPPLTYRYCLAHAASLLALSRRAKTDHRITVREA